MLFKRLLVITLLVVVAAGLVSYAKGYVLFQASMLLAYVIALVGLNLLTGYNGQISLGHGAFFAIGAYTVGILMDKADVSYVLAVPAAGVVSLVFGYAFGRPALKLQGLYLALATFTLGVVTPQLLKYKHLEPLTGGVGGIVLIKPDAPFGLPLNADQWLFVYALVVTGVMIWLARNLIESGSGRALRAIRDHEMAAESMGVDNRHYKSMAFGVSAAFTGVGGGLSALAVQFVSPDSFTMFLSISLLVGMVVGGVGTLWGAFFGAAFIMFVPSVAESISKDAAWGVYGVVLILFMFVLPGGVMGLLARLRRGTPVTG
ncbi:branched-chain amino acid ABC transporter permease [Hydrogenophaga sp. H7]|uniref:branched-chain amino acid ABC transporter permease n=1 Tax=Hydrogenophaga sp. H7 TaxID=1882399 RepID=UPI0009D13782|nr:branched-chain amino acid ABC transporter permease [Hydrogenophaga sp. H7]OPF61917.1 ABC transporter permease [Hydrogenophaga sp. H7]